MPQADRAGLSIFWRIAGEGARPALLLHCSLAHSGALKGLMARLSDLFTMTAFDMPGHGRSADRPGGESLQEAVVAVARSFLDEIDGPLDLIGHSFGGTSLLRIAYETPEKVRSLTLIEPPFYDAARAAGDPRIAEQIRADTAFASWQSAGERERAARAFLKAWGTGQGWEDMTDDQRAYFVDRIHLIEGAGNALNADRVGMLAPGGLERIRCPVLLIRGSLSPMLVPAVHDALLARLPDAREVVVDGAGHMVPVTHPDPVADAIRDFVSG